MATFHYFLKARVDMNKYSSGKALLDRWLDEAEAAEGAEKAGALQTLWRDASEPVVYGVLKLDADNALQAHAVALEALKGLPLGQDNALIIEESRVVFPYAEWRQFLRQRKTSESR